MAQASEEEILRQADLHQKLWSMSEFRAFEEFKESKAKVYLEELLLSVGERQRPVSDEYLKGAIYGLRLPFALSRAIMQAAAELRATQEENDDGD